MVVTYIKIESLADVDIDTLWTESLTRVNVNFFDSFPGISTLTDDEKKAYYYGQIQNAISGNWVLKKPEDTLFAYKVQLDGVDRKLCVGYIDPNGSFTAIWYLNAPGPSGNRNWLYTEETRAARKQFFADNGIESIKHITFVGSDLYNFLKYRAAAGYYAIIDETLTTDPNLEVTRVTLTVKLL